MTLIKKKEGNLHIRYCLFLKSINHFCYYYIVDVIIRGKFCIILTFFLYSIKSFHFNMISITLKKLFTFRVYNRQPLAQVWAISFFFFSFISIIYESLEYIVNIRAIEPIQ